MNTASEYFARTASATKILFDGIDSYIQMLRGHGDAIFVTSYSDEEDLQAQFDEWTANNSEAITKRQEAFKRFSEESFAMSVLCGAVLQIAAKSIEVYSTNSQVPVAWRSLIGERTKPVPFCIGREIRGVPLGLVIYAGRNQHTHYEDRGLRSPNVEVFDMLARNHEYSKTLTALDPTFNLADSEIRSFANNITGIMGWRSYDAYLEDMESLLA